MNEVDINVLCLNKCKYLSKFISLRVNLNKRHELYDFILSYNKTSNQEESTSKNSSIIKNATINIKQSSLSANNNASVPRSVIFNRFEKVKNARLSSRYVNSISVSGNLDTGRIANLSCSNVVLMALTIASSGVSTTF